MKIKIIKDYKRYCIKMAAACARKAHATKDEHLKRFYFSAEAGFLARV